MTDSEKTNKQSKLRIKPERLQQARRIWLATRSLPAVQKELGGRYKTWQRCRVEDDWDGMLEAVDAHDKRDAVVEARKRRQNNLTILSKARTLLFEDLQAPGKKLTFSPKAMRQLVQTEEQLLHAVYGTLGIGSADPRAQLWSILLPLLEGLDADVLTRLEGALATNDDSAFAEPDADPDAAHPPDDEADET